MKMVALEGKVNSLQAQDDEPYSEPTFGKFLNFLGDLGISILMPLTCGAICNPYHQVPQGFDGIVLRFGRVERVVEQGLQRVNPVSESLKLVDVRMKTIPLERQNVLTRDNLSIKIDGVVFYTVLDIDKAIYKVQNIQKAVGQLSMVALKSVFGQKLMQECLEQREELASAIEKIVSERIAEWGVKINMIQITDIKIPAAIERMLSSAATAEREGRAKVVMAQADLEAAKLMRQSSDILGTKGAMQFRLLDTYNKLASHPQTRIVFMPGNGRDGLQTLAQINTLYQ